MFRFLEVLCPQGVCVCVHFFTGHTFSDAHLDHFWESPGEKENVQNDVTPK